MTISRALTDSDITTGDRRSFRDADLIIEAANGTDNGLMSRWRFPTRRTGGIPTERNAMLGTWRSI